MPAIIGFSQLLGVKGKSLDRREISLLEADVFLRICSELKEFFREQQKNYFQLLKLSKEMEAAMLDENFVGLIIKDMLRSQEYTVEGLAQYTNFPEDIFYEIIEGRNLTPSANLLQRAIELHRTVRPELYDEIIKKIVAEYQSVS